MSSRPKTVPDAVRALRHRDFRWYISGQMVTFTGTWAQTLAMQWLVYQVLTKDSGKLGAVAFAAQIPTLLLGVTVGHWADHYNRKTMIVLANLLFFVQTSVLATVTLLHHNGVPLAGFWTIFCLALVGGVAQCMDVGARQALLSDLVPKSDLGNAIALNSLSFNSARIFGPVVAGWIIAAGKTARPDQPGFGEAICFILNGISCLAVLVTLTQVRTPGTIPHEQRSENGSKLEGFRQLLIQPHLKALLLFNAAMALLAIPYLVLVPVYAAQVLHGDEQTVSHLMAAVGVGALCGGAIMATRPSIKGLADLTTITACGFGMAVLVAANISGRGIGYVTFGVAGFFMVMTMIAANTMAQTLVPANVRGRALSVFSMATVGLMPIGNLVTGYIAKYQGVKFALGLCGAATLVVIAAFRLRLRELRAHARTTPEYQAAMEKTP